MTSLIYNLRCRFRLNRASVVNAKFTDCCGSGEKIMMEVNMKKALKKLAVGLLSLTMLVSFSGCGKKNGDDGSSSNIPTNDDGVMREELTSLELVKLMGNGINLGNTMEAYGRISLGTDAEVTQYETFWGQPVTTEEMIAGMKKSGFDTLRIPVAWTNMMDFESGDYTIDEAYLDRVEEIINYALNQDMYVIVNDHWDGGWWGMFGSADAATREKAMELYTSMWKQIATRYKRYSDKLIFESGNEEIGSRLNDTDIAEDSGTLSEDECYETANMINQTFVDTIRATGGNNEKRFLLIAGYGTDIKATLDDRFKMPEDTADSKLLLSVHYYDPSGYCLWEVDSWGTKDDYAEMNEKLETLKKFTDMGYGVIIGEYGVLPKEDTGIKDNTYEYTKNLLDNCDLYGYVPVLWDTNGLYDKEFCSLLSATITKLLQGRNVESEKALSDEEIIANAKKGIEEAYANAKEGFKLDDNVAMAWIMYTSSDWTVQYSVGDIYNPTLSSGGITATDVEVTGEGTYTVALDFTGTEAGYADSMAFSALAIANGETLYEGYVIDIKEIKINGEVYTPIAKEYTASDDKLCTRVNLYNEWVSEVPEDIRTVDGDTANVSPVIIDAANLGQVKTIEITFDYIAP